MRRWLYLGALVAVVGLIAFEIATSSGSGQTGKPAPPLPDRFLQGRRLTLRDLRGRPALLLFWASWCEPCREEAPHVAQLDSSLHGSARLVGIDYTDREGSARSFLRRYGWTFPVLSDPEGIYGARFGFGALPTTIVLDAKGTIAAVLHGPQSVASFRRALQAAG